MRLSASQCHIWQSSWDLLGEQKGRGRERWVRTLEGYKHHGCAWAQLWKGGGGGGGGISVAFGLNGLRNYDCKFVN